MLQVLGTPGTEMEACRWILEVQRPPIGKWGLDLSSSIRKMGEGRDGRCGAEGRPGCLFPWHTCAREAASCLRPAKGYFGK